MVKRSTSPRPVPTPPAIWVGTLALAAIAAAIYAISLPAPFLPDDLNAVANNPRIRDLSDALTPPRDTPVAGRPIVNLAFAVNYALTGLDVRGFRAVNIALHIVAALLLFGIVRRTVARLRPEDDGRAATWIGWACAAVWLAHPLHTESVIYLSQRTELMMGIAFLATLYCSIRRWHTFAIIACALGMASKESMVTAPVVVVLYDRVFAYDSFRTAFRARKGFYMGLAATWLLLAALLAGQPRGTIGPDANVSMWTYLLNQCRIVVHYLQLVVWPRDLVWDYGLPQPLVLADVWPQTLLLTALFALTIVWLIKQPIVGFLLAWFFITLAPTSSFVPITTEVGAERRMYLPLAGLAVLFVLALRRVVAAAPAAQRLQYAGIGIVVALLGVGSIDRARDYQSLRRLAETTVERWPNGRGHFQLATALYEEGEHEQAFREFQIAARDFPGARYALAVEYAARNQSQAALTELELFLRAMPDHPNAVAARDLAGRLFLSIGRPREALAMFDQVLRDDRYPQRSQVLMLREQARRLLPP